MANPQIAPYTGNKLHCTYHNRSGTQQKDTNRRSE